MSRTGSAWQQTNVFAHNSHCLCLSPSNNPAHRYYLTTDPVTGRLYVSDTNSRRIYSPQALLTGSESQQNVEVVVGTGDHCLPFDETQCGDGGLAIEALLTGPKGIFKVSLKLTIKRVMHSSQGRSWETWVLQTSGMAAMNLLRRTTHFDWHERSSQSSVSF